MNEKPCVLIVSSSNTRPKSLIKLITKSPNIVEEPSDSNVIIHPWTIDTKYYTTEINIIGINENYKRSESFNENIEALIIHIDTNKTSGLDDLSTWFPLLKDSHPEIQLLIANYCTNETKITKQEATEWCLKHNFELIELFPGKNLEQHLEQDIIEEKVGVERIIEALQTHTWPNWVIKSHQSPIATSSDPNAELAEVEDDFSEIFTQFSMMKESIQSMPRNQRKQCAEQVVTAFWKAIGGEEEEIEIDDL